ncbi:short chain dehydrogenase [Colletotrichum musicola]|uniref:Short chain dehydrogenase n=1 Tax=Colletotrichum musicola TaxID=2175873 RepID=A0A8H6KBZ4_9PEZI|nr:short chain dehydrogenase [Colletotrichum musicola]
MSSQPKRPVLAIIGAGSMGLAIAHRLGPGHHIVIGDVSADNLSRTEVSLKELGHLFTSCKVDVWKKEDVEAFAKTATAVGLIRTVVLNAGLSRMANDARQIYETNLIGTALVIETFSPLIAQGGSLIAVSSLAGHMRAFDQQILEHFATAPISKLLDHPEIDLEGDPGAAYCFSKRGVIVRAQYAAMAWGRRGLRINTISPGGVMTPMVLEVLESPDGAWVQGMIDATPVGRIGTSNDIAGAVAFLAGPDASFVNGSDLVVDGGTLPTHLYNAEEAPEWTKK